MSREVEFIGTLFVNTSKDGKKYLKGKINGFEVFGHMNQQPRKDNPDEIVTRFNIELCKDENGQPIKAEDGFKKVDVKPAIKKAKVIEVEKEELPF